VSRVAIVTGAGRGIGAATVALLAADGWKVIAVDRGGDDPRLPYPMASEAELDAVVAAVNREAPGGDAARAAVADASDEAAMTAVVAAAEQWGELEAIVAAAGVIAGGAPAWELPVAQQQAVLDVCLGGVIVAARVAMPALLRRPQPRSARFVAVASAAASRGLPGLAAYCAAKAGVAGFVRALATDLRATGVTANAIAPGSTDTPILAESARLYGLDSAHDFAAQQPIERLLDPAEPAALIRWLLSSEAAAVTGATLPVDGGLSV
jgi:SDR family mycofactocin-dependent oxidoreductase